MIDSKIYERIKFVEYLVDKNRGTKVTSDIDKVDTESGVVAPLQSALGYEIKDIFGPNFLIVEGKSDKRYILTISEILKKQGGEGLNKEWSIVPATGVSKVSSFISIFATLIGGNRNIVTVVDDRKNDKDTINNIVKKELLKKDQVVLPTVF